jgi:DNA invertase Pin-like site-specific DNA recombinase
MESELILGAAMRIVAIYSRVSTDQQSTENQERELREVAERAGWNIVQIYRDEGVSGAKSRESRPGFDAL